MDRRIRRLAIAIAAGHTLLLAAYTMPAGVVPLRLRYWSQAYARVLFHQDWRLFAPDPPECVCSISLQRDAGSSPQRLEDLHRGFIWKRMAANACRYAEASYDPECGCTPLNDALQGSLLNMTGRDPRVDGSTMHVVRSCGPRSWEIRFAQTPVR